MTPILTYRGRDVHPSDIESIRDLIANHPHACRQELSRLLCRSWNWVQPNGQIKDMICRGLLLRFHESGIIRCHLRVVATNQRPGICDGQPRLPWMNPPSTASRCTEHQRWRPALQTMFGL